MQKYYQNATNQVQKALKESLASLRENLTNEGLNIEKIATESMAVEVVSFLLVECLTKERMAFHSFDGAEKAREDALKIVKTAVIQYRGNNLVPPRKHQIH
jgi:L-rhamnose isomerase